VRSAAIFLLTGALFASESTKEIKPRLPALASVFPQGAERGITLQVEILGEHLAGAQSVLFLDNSIRGRVLASDYTTASLELNVDAQAPFGPHYFRLVSPRGASNILLFRVGDQPHINEKEPNSTFDQAQEVSLPVTINGRLNVDGDFDFYKFRFEKGQSWIFDLRAARNGSGLDPALILLDSHGRKLEHSEDVFIWDPFISYTFAEAGIYYAVVQPTSIRNDPTFAYQLDIRLAPHLETISPISMQPGATVEATIFGVGLRDPGKLWFRAPGCSGDVLDMRGSTARVKIHCLENVPEGPTALAITTPGGQSNPATFLIDATPLYIGGAIIRPPVSITSTARYRQPEHFSFEVTSGQTLVFEVRAQRFGSPVDSILRILDDKGKEIAVNDDYDKFPGVQFNKDSFISYTFKNAGRYQVEIRNLWKTTGEDFPYQLLVRLPKPEFELMLASDNPYIYPDGKGTLKVTAVRKDGYKEPIPLQIAGLPAGINAEAAEIAAGKSDAEIPLTAAGVQPGVYGQIQVLAPGAPAAWRSDRIASGGGEGATVATVHQATLAVIERPLFSLEALATNLNLARGATAVFQVAIQRAAGFDEPIAFEMTNLPNGVGLAKTVAGPGDDRVKIHLTAAKDAQPVRFSRVVVIGHAQGGQVQEAPKIAIVVD
jgi:hypothetical protein